MAAALVLLVVGCSASDLSDIESPATTGVSTGDVDETGSFVGMPDGGSVAIPCELLDDDCPSGQKCAAYAMDGGDTPDAARCVPVAAPASQVGDACRVEGWIASGLDDCDRELACWGVDPGTLVGTCVPLCEAGAPPSCADPNRRCRHAGGPLRICLLACNPLAAECGEDKGCYPYDGWPSCLPDASGSNGIAGDPCVFLNGCEPGLYCAPAADVPGCRASDCCTSFCAISMEGAECPASPSQTCVAFFPEEVPAPEGLEDLGVCAVP